MIRSLTAAADDGLSFADSVTKNNIIMLAASLFRLLKGRGRRTYLLPADGQKKHREDG